VRVHSLLDITPVTWAGKLVVSGSIIAGVAIVPAQAAALFEALFQKELKDNKINKSNVSTAATITASRRRRNTIASSNGSITDTTLVSDEKVVLDMVLACRMCGKSLHWSHARYCYSCGEEL
jgi:hypothetical protein